MNEEMAQKIALYKEFNRSMEDFKKHNFDTNRFYISTLIVILLIILTAKQIFVAGSLIFTFIFSLFGLCIAVMWVISQDSYKYLIRIKLGKVLEEIEKELPVKPYTIEHEAIIEYKKHSKALSYDGMQKLFAFAIAAIFTIMFFTELAPFCIMIKALMM